MINQSIIYYHPAANVATPSASNALRHRRPRCFFQPFADIFLTRIHIYNHHGDHVQTCPTDECGEALAGVDLALQKIAAVVFGFPSMRIIIMRMMRMIFMMTRRMTYDDMTNTKAMRHEIDLEEIATVIFWFPY